MSNTPSDRGADCTALALCKRELVRVYGEGTIDEQRGALLRVLEHRRAKVAFRDRLIAAMDKRPRDRMARVVQGIAMAQMHEAMQAQQRGDTAGAVVSFLQALAILERAEELVNPTAPDGTKMQ